VTDDYRVMLGKSGVEASALSQLYRASMPARREACEFKE
jgi:hypothetical protein